MKAAAAAAREIEGVRITHPDKKYWPDDGYTKGDLIAFYAAVLERLRPYVDDRLLSLERCPDGMRGGVLLPEGGAARACPRARRRSRSSTRRR